VDEATRRRIEEFVRPLDAGLDGLTDFGDARRVVAAAEKMARSFPDFDHELLYLLAIFSGQERWVSRMGNRSRTEMFLASLGVPEGKIAALFRGLARFASRPATPEEEIVHDAVKLEGMGARGIARHLLEGRREGLGLSEMASRIEEAAGAPLRTEAGEALAAERRRVMMDYAARLREEESEFQAASLAPSP
jgi:hypothetical protein